MSAFIHDEIAKKIANANKNLGIFFEGVTEYNETPELKTEHALRIARFIYNYDTYVYNCTQGIMSNVRTETYVDHNSEDNWHDYYYRAYLISEDEYNRRRAEKPEQINTEEEISYLEKYHLDASILEDDYLITKCSYYRLKIVARVKGIHGYYYFSMEK